MFKVVYEDGLHVPSAFCDACGERIEEAKEGNFSWNALADGDPEMIHLHKYCQRPFESSNYTVAWYAQGLDVLTTQLESSLSVDRDSARHKARWLASI